jgi:phage terminase large subunit-like protein
MTTPMVHPLDAYATAVVDGQVPAGKYHRLACARHLRDRAREETPSFPYRFDLARAERFFRFAGKLKHYKGEWAGQYIQLQPHQLFRLGSIFGWVHVETGLRRFRTSYNEIPRKNGKSLEAAVVALYLTFFDREPGANGYTIATKRDQAKIVFNDASALVGSSGLRSRIAVRVANLHVDATSSKLEPLGADHDSTDGLNPSLVIVDEFHAHKTRGLIDVMETATGARRQPLTFQITTAGDDPVSPGGDQHDYACKILDGILVDESFFAFIAHADPEDDWLAETTWVKANPNWGVSVNPDDMRALALKAKSMPSAAATFKQKRLNWWVSASNPCLSVEGWRKGQNPHRQAKDAWLAELEHQPCYAGIDLASKIDLCCCALVFPPTPTRGSWRLIQHIWTPADTLADRAHRDRAPYPVWLSEGWLIATPGSIIDHQLIRIVLKAAREHYDLHVVGFDPWHADTLIHQLTAEDGFPETQVLAVPQTYAGMSSACLKMQAEILAGNVDARACPVTAWSVSNCVDQRDGKDNMMFVKKKSRGRIDPVIAPTIAMALALRAPVAPEPAFQAFVFGGGRG